MITLYCYFAANFLIILYSFLKYKSKYDDVITMVLAIIAFMLFGVPLLIVFFILKLHLRYKGIIK